MSHTVVVTTPAEDQDLCTLDEVKLRLGIADTDTSKDALLGDLITRGSAMIEAYLGRTIAVQTYTETWRAPSTCRRDSITLAYAPVTVLTSVTENATLLTVATDYEFEPQTGIVYRITEKTRLRWGYEVIVVYDSGWVTVPSAISSVCVDLVTVAYTQGRHDSSVRLELTQGVGRVEYFDRGWSTFAFDDALKCTLQPYVAIVA